MYFVKTNSKNLIIYRLRIDSIEKIKDRKPNACTKKVKNVSPKFVRYYNANSKMPAGFVRQAIFNLSNNTLFLSLESLRILSKLIISTYIL